LLPGVNSLWKSAIDSGSLERVGHAHPENGPGPRSAGPVMRSFTMSWPMRSSIGVRVMCRNRSGSRVEQQMALERVKAEEQLTRQRARAKSLRLVIVSLLLVTSFMIYLAVKAFRGKSLAHAREIAAYSKSQKKNDPELGLLLAIEAVKKRQTPQSIEALKELLVESQLKVVLRGGHTKAVRDVDFNPAGRLRGHGELG